MAPKFKKELLDVVDYLNFNIELVEISRYKTDAGEFLVIVNKPQSTAPAKATVKVMEEWNWEKWQKQRILDRLRIYFMGHWRCSYNLLSG